MPCCSATGCSTREFNKNVYPPITFHFFPSDPELRWRWIQALNRGQDWEPTKASRLCSKHFREEDFDRSPFYTKLRRGAVPSIFNRTPQESHMQHERNRCGVLSRREYRHEAGVNSFVGSGPSPFRRLRVHPSVVDGPRESTEPAPNQLSIRIPQGLSSSRLVGIRFVRMCWNEEKVSRLIDLYSKLPLLWDQQNPDYKNRERKTTALNSISESIGVNVIEVERKINVLLAQYRKNRLRAMKMKEGGLDAEAIENSLWWAYNKLSFLEDRYSYLKLKEKQPGVKMEGKANENENGDRSQEKLEEDDDSDPMMDECLQDKVEVCLSEGRGPEEEERWQRRRRILRASRRLGRKQPRCCCPRTEEGLFAGQMALKLARLPPAVKASLMHRIFNMLHDEEMRLYNGVEESMS